MDRGDCRKTSLKNQLFAFTCFMQSMWSWETIQWFTTAGCKCNLANQHTSSCLAQTGYNSQLLQFAVLVSNPRDPPPQGCRNGWPSEILELFDLNLPHIDFSECPMAGLNLLILSSFFTFTSPEVAAQMLDWDCFMWYSNILPNMGHKNRWRLVLFFWQTSYWCLINNIITVNHLVAPTSTSFLSGTGAHDRGEWLCHVCLQ